MNIKKKLMDYATEYEIKNYKLSWRGNYGWGIYEINFNGTCYNKVLNMFVHEPLPSNREDKFFKECRFGLNEGYKLIDILNKKI